MIKINLAKTEKLLIYTCCDKKYETFIPLYCLSLLEHNNDICIEICIQDTLSSNANLAINILKSKYGNDSIHIVSIPFVNIKSGYIEYNKQVIMLNTLRFITNPTQKAEYVYISDIDIICMENIIDGHIKHMNEINKRYSNIVRPNTNHLSGLHFSEYDFYYPVNLDGIDVTTNDEVVLYNIVSKKTELDKTTKYRPVHGIHMSLNRPTVKGDEKIPGWGAEPYKEKWIEFKNTDIYKQIKPYFEGDVITQIKKLDAFYEI